MGEFFYKLFVSIRQLSYEQNWDTLKGEPLIIISHLILGKLKDIQYDMMQLIKKNAVLRKTSLEGYSILQGINNEYIKGVYYQLNDIFIVVIILSPGDPVSKNQRSQKLH